MRFFKNKVISHTRTYSYIGTKLGKRYILILNSTQGKITLFGLIMILGKVKQRLLHLFQFKLFIHLPIIAHQKPQRCALKF